MLSGEAEQGLCFVPDPCSPSLSLCCCGSCPPLCLEHSQEAGGGFSWCSQCWSCCWHQLCVCLAEGAACAAPAPLPYLRCPACTHLASGMNGQSWHKEFFTLYQKLPWDFPKTPNPLARGPQLGILILGHWHKTRGSEDTKSAI